MEDKIKTAKELEESLCYHRTAVADALPGISTQVDAFCADYRAFLDAAKTEREAVTESERMLLQAGYQPYQAGVTYPAGSKVYQVHRAKCVLAVTIGTESLEKGFRLNISHIDSPRLDLRPMPLYENTELAFFKTHYYGGIRKYQWATLPLAIHGVAYLADGTQVTLCVGEAESDPVFCITDLLPHLAATQNERKLAEGIKGEELNLLIGSLGIEDQSAKNRVKLHILQLLNEKYGLCEKDFIRAEIEIVPAQKAREVGLDRSMIGAYGQDDRVDAYAALRAEIEMQDPRYTTVCILTDKEETGSDGVTGLNSMYAFHFLQQLCEGQGANAITAFQNAICLSADVTAAYDPNWPDVFEAGNATYAGKGVALCKYTGARGKSGTSDASAELVAWITGILDQERVVWQIGELGKVDQGGGGTVAKFVASHDIATIDIGVPVLSMHSPFEVVSKNDVYMAYLAFKAFGRH